jgi:antitoxin component YwqK of YwqJK toxin-antitoxin module
MNNIILPFFCCLLACLFSSCIQSSPSAKVSPARDKTVMLHWLDLDDNGIVRLTGNDGNLSKSSKPFSGEAIETFEQSPTKSVSQWLEGIKHGTTTEYFYNGRKRRVINYKNGIKNGIAEEYRITGELLRQETYQDAKLNGPKSEWHPNGAKILDVQMRNAKPHGEALEWYPDGLEKSSTIYRHGLREGPSSEWYPNGQRKLGLFYQKDKQHGQRTIWYEDGQKRLTAQFEEDMMEGNSQGWFPNGQQQFDYNFQKNLEHGVCTEWNSKGTKISEIRFVDGTATQNLLTGEKIASPNIEVKESTPEPPSISEDGASQSVNPTLNPSDQGLFAPPSNANNSAIKPRNIPIPNATTGPEMEKPKEILVPTPPPPPAPSFNPFGDDPLQPKVNTIETETFDVPVPPPPAPAFNPFEENPSKPNQPEIPVPNGSLVPPPPPPSFNPFEDDPLPQPPKPLEDQSLPPPPPPPVTVDPVGITAPESIPQAESRPFDPFATEEGEPKKNSSADVPLGDVFNSPPTPIPVDSSFDNIPPPPPPSFNPFDLPPLPGE